MKCYYKYVKWLNIFRYFASKIKIARNNLESSKYVLSVTHSSAVLEFIAPFQNQIPVQKERVELKSHSLSNL